MSDPAPEKPQRRKRYPGTHPRRFDEKYKELDPSRFPTEAEKVRAQGRTPAGTHVPVMLREVLEALHPAPGEIALECTLGHGGHAEALARAGARVIGIDLDAEELARTQARLAGLELAIEAHHTNFAGIAKVLAAAGLDGVHCLLADLGLSSMQLDHPQRGFGFKHDGPLDMRMDRTRGRTAAELISQTSAPELAEILRDYGDARDADTLAEALKAAAPQTTAELAAVVLRHEGLDTSRYRKRSARDRHPAAAVFQALRMAVNREPANLEHLLRVLPQVLKPGGRAAIMTFHSGEERKVRESLTSGLKAGIYTQAELTGKAPTSAEVYNNPRARSARLFWAVRA
jgi:16S rRNA (cytosine1402-N4)-methyltransferase